MSYTTKEITYIARRILRRVRFAYSRYESSSWSIFDFNGEKVLDIEFKDSEGRLRYGEWVTFPKNWSAEDHTRLAEVLSVIELSVVAA